METATVPISRASLEAALEQGRRELLACEAKERDIEGQLVSVEGLASVMAEDAPERGELLSRRESLRETRTRAGNETLAKKRTVEGIEQLLRAAQKEEAARNAGRFRQEVAQHGEALAAGLTLAADRLQAWLDALGTVIAEGDALADASEKLATVENILQPNKKVVAGRFRAPRELFGPTTKEVHWLREAAEQESKVRR